MKVAMPLAQLREYEGVYRIDEKTTRTFTVDDDGRAYSQRSGGQRLEVLPRGRDQFFYENSFSTMEFERGADGKLVAVTVTQDGKSGRAPRTDGPVARRVTVSVSPEKLDRYVGRYTLAPERFLTIRRKGNELWGQMGAGREFQLYSESEEKWIVKEVDAQLTFTFGANGTAARIELLQGGRKILAERVLE